MEDICVFSESILFNVIFMFRIWKLFGCAPQITKYYLRLTKQRLRPQCIIMFSITWNDSSGPAMTLLDSSRQKAPGNFLIIFLNKKNYSNFAQKMGAPPTPPCGGGGGGEALRDIPTAAEETRKTRGTSHSAAFLIIIPFPSQMVPSFTVIKIHFWLFKKMKIIF